MDQKGHKYIFVIGGVMSGVGKGVASSSIGKILQDKGFKMNAIKIDPYLNVDAGTMNPTEHGEVFVLDSGLECDQDMGNYERFMDINMGYDDYITSGMVYKYVIEKERNLGFKGKCVEAIPDITSEIIRRIKKSAEISKSQITLVEIGGTVGDYQNIMFMEAARILKLKNPNDVFFILVSYLPIPNKIGEMKTRPTQNAVRMLNSYGIQPDMVIARSEVPLDKKRKEKISISCNIPTENVISAPDIDSIYEIPINFERDKLGDNILESISLKKRKTNNSFFKWRKFFSKIESSKKTIDIAIVGKYFDTGDFVLSDAYVSVIEAVKFSSYQSGFKPRLEWLNSKDFDDNPEKVSILSNYHGVIVPGGFGEKGIEGKLEAIKYVRENKIPYLGLCYGMQLAVIEYARNVLGIKNAMTAEIDSNAENLIIDIMPEQKKNLEKNNYGASMRLGSYPAIIEKGTIAYKAYKKTEIEERHRHRYEVNPKYIENLVNNGLIFSGKSPDNRFMEIMELPQDKHPFFVGTQFHPEFKARPMRPHPIFTEFIKSIIKKNTNLNNIN